MRVPGFVHHHSFTRVIESTDVTGRTLEMKDEIHGALASRFPAYGIVVYPVMSIVSSSSVGTLEMGGEISGTAFEFRPPGNTKPLNNLRGKVSIKNRLRAADG
jgi:hypothetical protein